MNATNPERLRELLAAALEGVTVNASGCISYPTETAHLSVSFLAKHGAALLHQLAELEALRQACWDARAVLGFDNDGDPTPDALVHPSLADLVRRDAAEFRKDYDEACNEAHAAERAREGLLGYVRHAENCETRFDSAYKPRPNCTCGLAAFLAASGGA